MAELTTLARPYAKAAFEVARSARDLAGWSAALALLAEVCATPTLRSMLGAPALTSAAKSAALVEVCGDGLNPAQRNFVAVLAENRRLGLIAEVRQLFELYKANQEKSVDVSISTAYAMSPELEQALVASLTKKLEREVSLNTAVDKSLLGGALIRAGDTVIDGSVRGRLAKLGEALGA